MNTNKETAADSAVAMQNRQGLGEIRLDGRILTRTVLQAKHDNRAASQSLCHETQTEAQPPFAEHRRPSGAETDRKS